MTVFLAILDPSPYDGIMTFSALYDVFNQPPTYTENRAKETDFSHYKSYMTIWPHPPPPEAS